MTRGRKLELVLILGALSAFAPLSIDMYLPAFPVIQRDLHAGPGQVQWTLSAFFLAFAAGQTIYGPVTDRWGRRRPLYATLALFALASLLCAAAPTIGALTAGRLLQGIAAAAGIVIARAVVRDYFEKQEAAQVFSTLMLVSGLAPMLAPTLGGLVLDAAGWRAIFIVLAALGLACLAGAHLQLGESYAGSSAVGFSPREVARQYARVWRQPPFARAAVTGGLALMGMFVYITCAPFVFIGRLGFSERWFGAIFGINALGMVALSQWNARLLRAHAPELLLRRGTLLQTAAGTVLLLCAFTGFGGPAGVVVPLFLFLACQGLILPNTLALAMAPFRADAGSASALLGTLQYSMAAAVTALVGALHAERPLPMAALMLVCAAAACCLARIPPGKPIDPTRQSTPS